MSRKRVSVKGGVSRVSGSIDSGAVVPGTAQSGASEPIDSAAGAAELGDTESFVIEPGTEESGATESSIVPSRRSASGVFETGDLHTDDYDSSVVKNETIEAKNLNTPMSSIPDTMAVENSQPARNPSLAAEDQSQIMPDKDALDIDARLRSAADCTQAGDFASANSIYQELLGEIDNESHEQMVECLWGLANNLYLLAEVEESIPLFKRLVSVQEVRLGQENDQLITPLLRLAIALKKAGEVAESEETFQRSMALAKRVNPAGNSPAPENSDTTGDGEVVPTFVHPLNESMLAQDPNSAPPALDANSESAGTSSTDPEAEVLKYLFSDNAPAHVVKKMSEIKQNKPSAGRTNALSRSGPPVPTAATAPIDYEKGFIDRNPAATRLSDLDLAALGAIPSTDVMKSMFSESSFHDPQIRSTRSTAFLKANESGEEPVKFADSTKRFDAKEAAPFLVRNKWLVPTLVGVVAVVAIVFISKSFSGKNADHPSKASSIHAIPDKLFASFDKETVLQTFKNSAATYTTGDKSHRAICHFLDGDPRDFFSVIPGSYSGSDIWMQQTSDGLKLSDGTTLYSATAPINAVVKQMTEIAQCMQAYHGANRSYPVTPEQFQAALNSAVYINPITHKGDPPKFFTTYSSSIGSSAKKLEIKTEAGENWINETNIAPGEIHCCCLIYEDPAGHQPLDQVNTGAPGTSGNGTDFFIRAGDIDGHFIPGNKPGATFYIELNQGKSSELTNMLNLPSKPLDLGKTRILIARDFSEQMIFLFFSGAIPALLLMGIGGGWFIQHQLYEDNDQLSQTRKKVVTQVLVASSVLLALWIAVCALG